MDPPQNQVRDQQQGQLSSQPRNQQQAQLSSQLRDPQKPSHSFLPRSQHKAQHWVPLVLQLRLLPVVQLCTLLKDQLCTLPKAQLCTLPKAQPSLLHLHQVEHLQGPHPKVQQRHPLKLHPAPVLHLLQVLPPLVWEVLVQL